MTKTNIESKMIKDEYSPNVGLIGVLFRKVRNFPEHAYNPLPD